MKDRYERKHRRSTRRLSAANMATMAGANFDAAPSLSEAMGLEDEPMTESPDNRAAAMRQVWDAITKWRRCDDARSRDRINAALDALCLAVEAECGNGQTELQTLVQRFQRWHDGGLLNQENIGQLLRESNAVLVKAGKARRT